MSLHLFLEKTDILPKGAYVFTPKHSTPMLSDNIDAVYFPYMINGGFLTAQMKTRLKKFIPQEYLDTRLEYEYVDGQVPKYLCNIYRKRLKKTHPSLQHKHIVFLHIADFPFPYDVDENMTIVRCSVDRSTMHKRDIVMPSRVPYEDWWGPQKNITSSIGFCGCPHTHPTRKKLLQDLDALQEIDFDSFYTSNFYNHTKYIVKHRHPNLSVAEREKIIQETRANLKEEFNQRLQRNIFSLCPRGRGNYSVRFYESLRAGRIPVMIDTDQVFPLEDTIDWGDIVICAKTTEELLQKVHDWTENRDLIEVQKRCREVWETYLHFPHFVELLPDYIEKSMS